MHGEPWSGATERVGGEDAGSRRRILGVDAVHDIGSLDVPELPGHACFESALLQERAHATVEEHQVAIGEQLCESVHGVTSACSGPSESR